MNLTDAKQAGQAAMWSAQAAAESAGFDSDGARRFIISFLRENGPTDNETLVDEAKARGYAGRDDRCFGGLFSAAIRAREIRVIRSDLPRRKGHGTTGAKLYEAV